VSRSHLLRDHIPAPTLQRYLLSGQRRLLERLYGHLTGCAACYAGYPDDCAYKAAVLGELAARQHLFDIALARACAQAAPPAPAEDTWASMPDIARLPVRGPTLVIAGGT
jgi:hypothetical protein